VWVPEKLIPDASEILFREAFEKISEKWGLQCTREGLDSKKRAFQEELKSKTARLSKPLKRFFQKFSQVHFNEMFRQDQELVDMGGEEILLVKAKERIDRKIKVFRDYLTNMEKLQKGYIFNSYTPKQTEDRKNVENRIAALEAERADTSTILNREIARIMDKNPVPHLRIGTIEELIKSESEGHVQPET